MGFATGINGPTKERPRKRGLSHRAKDRYADFFGAAFFAAFLAGARGAGLAALAVVAFTADFEIGECGRVLPWLPA